MESLPHLPLAEELLEMSRADQEMRLLAQQNQEALDETVDHRNTARLKEIVAATGWPTISQVGSEASQSAWTIVQHAQAEPEFMKHCLGLMKAAPKGEVALPNIALLEDRLLVMDQQAQLYGTQFRKRRTTWESYPIADPENVDVRRLAMGLNSLVENRAAIVDINSQQ